MLLDGLFAVGSWTIIDFLFEIEGGVDISDTRQINYRRRPKVGSAGRLFKSDGAIVISPAIYNYPEFRSNKQTRFFINFYR